MIVSWPNSLAEVAAVARLTYPWKACRAGLGIGRAFKTIDALARPHQS